MRSNVLIFCMMLFFPGCEQGGEPAARQLLDNVKAAPALATPASEPAARRKDKVLTKLRGGIKGLFGARNVTLYSGMAVLDGPGKINVTDEKGGVDSFTADKIILATGSVPVRIPGWPTDPELVCTSDEALHWKELPKRLLIVGAVSSVASLPA